MDVDRSCFAKFQGIHPDREWHPCETHRRNLPEGADCILQRSRQAYYKNAVVRYAKKVRRIVFLEKGNDRSWHNHLALERPERISEVKFRNLIRECWSRSEWAVPNKDIQFDGNRGWIEYIHKPRSKAVFLSWTDSIVLEACVNDTK